MVKQIYSLVNDAVEDALGQNSGVTKLETTDIVSLGKAISSYNAYESFFGALANRIAKTVYFIRVYEGKNRSILRDEHEYGAFIQKVYYDLPTAVENPTWNVATWSGSPAAATYSQESPYDIDTVVGVKALIYGGQGTWSIEIMRPIEQIKTAFLDESSMMSFIDGIYVAIENSFKLEEERLVALAVDTAMAHAINAGLSRNLLSEYNTNHSDATLTVEEAMESPDFLRFASKEIKDAIGHMGTMSTIFNAQAYPTFTKKENLVVEMLEQFENAVDTYLKSNTFHDELVALPNHEKVQFWQSSGKSFAFDDTSAINIEHDDLVTADNLTGVVNQSGIICFLHDTENVAAYFGERYSWEQVNPRSRVVNHGEQARKGFAVDTYANSYVFYIAEDSDDSGDDSGDGD